MEEQTTQPRKKRSLNLACNFCKTRHMKCDGVNPCVQCISRNEECVFVTNMKRGRKPKKPTVETAIVQLSEPIRVLPTEQSFHHLYFSKFVERVLPMFPMFMNKVNFCVHSISCNLSQNPTLANRYILLLLMIGYYYFSSKGSEPISVNKFYTVQAFAVYNLHSQHVTLDTRNRMFTILATSVPDLEDALHYVKKIKFSTNMQANCVNAILAAGSVSFALSVRHPTARIEDKMAVFRELLSLIEEAEQKFIIRAQAYISWIGLVWSGIKAYVLHQLGLEQQERPLDILLKLVDTFLGKPEKSPGNVGFTLASVFMLKIIPPSEIPPDTLKWCIETLSHQDIQFQGLSHLLRTLLDDLANPPTVVESPSETVEQSEALWTEDQLQDILLNFTTGEDVLLNPFA